MPMLGCSGTTHATSHRAPVWWTGDVYDTTLSTAISDEILGGLQFKPYVHPDCTGHHGVDEPDGGKGEGYYPPEAYARWVQFCSMGTIFRIHSAGRSNGRQPWKMGDKVESIMRNFTKMRLQLLPTLVAAGVKASAELLPVVRRLDLVFPDYAKDGADRNDQYLLGDDLLVAPIDPYNSEDPSAPKIDPRDGPFNRDRTVWLPPGEWHDVFSGQVHTGPKDLSVTGQALETMPLFHRGGGLLITAANGATAATASAVDMTHLVIDAFPLQAARDNHHVERLAHNNGKAHARITMEQTWTSDDGSLLLRLQFGSETGVQLPRWTVRVHCASECST